MGYEFSDRFLVYWSQQVKITQFFETDSSNTLAWRLPFLKSFWVSELAPKKWEPWRWMFWYLFIRTDYATLCSSTRDGNVSTVKFINMITPTVRTFPSSVCVCHETRARIEYELFPVSTSRQTSPKTRAHPARPRRRASLKGQDVRPRTNRRRASRG